MIGNFDRDYRALFTALALTFVLLGGCSRALPWSSKAQQTTQYPGLRYKIPFPRHAHARQTSVRVGAP